MGDILWRPAPLPLASVPGGMPVLRTLWLHLWRVLGGTLNLTGTRTRTKCVLALGLWCRRVRVGLGREAAAHTVLDLVLTTLLVLYPPGRRARAEDEPEQTGGAAVVPMAHVKVAVKVLEIFERLPVPVRGTEDHEKFESVARFVWLLIDCGELYREKSVYL